MSETNQLLRHAAISLRSGMRPPREEDRLRECWNIRRFLRITPTTMLESSPMKAGLPTLYLIRRWDSLV
jgi:hypothetical protein